MLDSIKLLLRQDRVDVLADPLFKSQEEAVGIALLGAQFCRLPTARLTEDDESVDQKRRPIEVIRSVGKRGRPAALMPPASSSFIPNKATASLTRPSRERRSNIGASVASIKAQEILVANTASG
jgi:hypothetical protein